jgi:hypothetical protein
MPETGQSDKAPPRAPGPASAAATASSSATAVPPVSKQATAAAARGPAKAAAKRSGSRSTFSGLSEAIEILRSQLAEAEKLQAERERQLAEIVGRRMIQEVWTSDKARDWLQRQLAKIEDAEARRVVQDFLSTAQQEPATHEQ